jgi:hypothetical protein
MPEKILKIAHRFMLNPVKILVRNDQLTLDGIRQFFVKVDSTADKASTLADLYGLLEKARGMIFCNSRNTVNEVAIRMNELGCPLQCIVRFFKNYILYFSSAYFLSCKNRLVTWTKPNGMKLWTNFVVEKKAFVSSSLRISLGEESTFNKSIW